VISEEMRKRLGTKATNNNNLGTGKYIRQGFIVRKGGDRTSNEQNGAKMAWRKTNGQNSHKVPYEGFAAGMTYPPIQTPKK